MDIAYGRKILTNALIVFGLSFLAGFLVGFVAAAIRLDPLLTRILTITLGWLAVVLGFVIVGRKTPREGYWPTLTYTAVAVWIMSLVQIVVGVTILQWALSIVMGLVMMGVGGGLALLTKRS